MQGVPKWFWASFTTFPCLLQVFCFARGGYAKIWLKKSAENFQPKLLWGPLLWGFFFPLILSYSLKIRGWNFYHCNKSKRVSWTWFFVWFSKLYLRFIFSHPLHAKEVGLAHPCIASEEGLGLVIFYYLHLIIRKWQQGLLSLHVSLHARSIKQEDLGNIH